jgi:inorganic triphosphatase YgiF
MEREREVELKLELEPGSSEALARHPLLAGGPQRTADQVSTYFDTSDHALRDAGFSLRVRESKGRFIQTIKQSSGPAAGLFDRPEWEREVGSAELDLDVAAETPLATLLDKKMRKRLRPVIKVEVRRRTWNIEREGSRIELICDEGTVTGGSHSQPIAEVELELKGGAAEQLIELARALGEKMPLRLGVLTKAERGYRLAQGSIGKVVKAERIQLQPGMSAAEGFAAIAYACLRHFRLNEDLIVSASDPAALHQARVAMRRLRSAFTLFRPVIADPAYQQLREEVRWFTNQLGDARNMDVLLKRFGSAKGGEAEALLAKLRSEREQAYARVIEALGSKRLRMLMMDLVGWIETGPWRELNSTAQLPLPHFGSIQLDRRWRKVRKGGAALAELETEARHQLRIEVKKLRYAVEFLASLTAGSQGLQRQKTFVTALEEMQEQLGELNDVETARELLSNLLGPDKPVLDYAQQRLGSSGSGGNHLEAAQKAHAALTEAGRFWR